MLCCVVLGWVGLVCTRCASLGACVHLGVSASVVADRGRGSVRF